MADEEEAGAGLGGQVVVAPPREQEEVVVVVVVAGRAVAADGRSAPGDDPDPEPGEEAGAALARRAGALLRPPLLLIVMSSVHGPAGIRSPSSASAWVVVAWLLCFLSFSRGLLLPCALNLFPVFVSYMCGTSRGTGVACIYVLFCMFTCKYVCHGASSVSILRSIQVCG